MSPESYASDALIAGGWHEERDAGGAATLGILRTVAVSEPVADGARWQLFPAAEKSLREFHGLRIGPVGPGRDVASTGCVVDPTEARHAQRSFAALGETIGTRLFPFGRTDADGLLAVDEEGRLFAVDHGGAWLLGESARSGLVALAEGRRPHRVERRTWSWPLDGIRGDRAMSDATRAAMVAVYVLHSGGAFSARAVRLRVTTLRGVGVLVLDETFPLRGDSLENSAGPMAQDMERAMAEHGVTARGAELVLSLVVPRVTTGPLATVDCSITVGSSPTPGRAVLTLTAGAGASMGRAANVLASCAADLAGYAGGPPAAGPVSGPAE
ncbi:SUKH-3 domain-containing protein [Streptomyces sp. AK02-01A]|uniref:SUKH-3 domain-containing protein n=1 Tax=Streptomyces sp. AK02-01A TaxID=3028648 RepID=UPI0029BF9280|nr:SUKH-3 domain-containing protein [Streptomyces sp. AK02-01A]MDX3850283.1 SUKH-3 domain-containing protein [Streptomyces sp. AK02-01A]